MTTGDDLRLETKTDDPEAPETSTGDGQGDETSTAADSNSVLPADVEPEKGPETEPQAEKLAVPEEPSEMPDAPPTFEQYLRSVAVRAPQLDGAAEAMATDVVREKGFEHVKAWRLPDGSILITKG